MLFEFLRIFFGEEGWLILQAFEDFMGMLLFAFVNGLEVMAFVEAVILECVLTLELLFA